MQQKAAAMFCRGAYSLAGGAAFVLSVGFCEKGKDKRALPQGLLVPHPYPPVYRDATRITAAAPLLHWIKAVLP